MVQNSYWFYFTSSKTLQYTELKYSTISIYQYITKSNIIIAQNTLYMHAQITHNWAFTYNKMCVWFSTFFKHQQRYKTNDGIEITHPPFRRYIYKLLYLLFNTYKCLCMWIAQTRWSPALPHEKIISYKYSHIRCIICFGDWNISVLHSC